MRSIASAVVSLLLGASLMACGGGGGASDEPAVCGSIDTLKTSVDKLKDIDLTASGAVSDLRTGITGIQSDLSDVKTDARSEFSSEIDAAEKSYGELKTSVSALKDNASVATLAATRSALSAFGADVEKLIKDIEATC